MKRCRDRWYSLIELAELLEQEHPKLAALSRPARRKFVWRLVRGIERRDREPYSRREGRALLVSQRALEGLRRKGQRPISELEDGLAQLRHEQKTLNRKVNGHGARIHVLERKQALTTRHLQDVHALEKPSTGT